MRLGRQRGGHDLEVGHALADMADPEEHAGAAGEHLGHSVAISFFSGLMV